MIKQLRERIKGRVLDEPGDLKKFSRDQSIYQIQPRAVVLPEDIQDIVKTVQLAADSGITITPRGGGSGTAGAGLGHGIMIAFERSGPFNRIANFDPSAKKPSITLDAGVMHSRMQTYLRERGFFLPADPSSDYISLIGGNVATKASGPHALQHGSIDRYVKHLCFIDNRGALIDTAEETTIPTRIADGIRQLKQTIAADKETVQRLRKRARRKIASGYNLFAFLRDLSIGELTAQLLVGSVGTLGVITSATLAAEPYIEGRATMVIPFKNLHEAGDAVQHIRGLGVAAIEIIDAETIRIVKQHRKKAFEKRMANNLLLVEFAGPGRMDQIEAVKKVISNRGYDLDSQPYVASDEASQEKLWQDRKLLLPAILNYNANLKALSVVNDIGIDPAHLADFILEIQAIFKRHGLTGAIYGHAGSGNLHLRPLFDITRPDLEQLIQRLADDIYEAAFEYDGAITAEHGMGRLRAPYLEAEWGETIVRYMKQLKHIFDPGGLFNPDVMFSNRAITRETIFGNYKGGKK